MIKPVEWTLAHGRSLTLGPKSHIMGILNVTPNSFSDGGQFVDLPAAEKRARQMIEQGATIIDIGGESTKPGVDPVDGATERERVLPVIKLLAQSTEIIISVDTYRAETAEAAVHAGAHIVNDVWGCQREPDIAEVAARYRAGLAIMSTRREREVEVDLIRDALAFLEVSLKIAKQAGVQPSQMVLDPGFGFAATTAHDIPLLQKLERLHQLGLPLMVGTSRKRFLGELTGRDGDQRGVATAATSVVARMKGAAIFRVHDIPENADALAVADAVVSTGIEL